MACQNQCEVRETLHYRLYLRIATVDGVPICMKSGIDSLNCLRRGPSNFLHLVVGIRGLSIHDDGSDHHRQCKTHYFACLVRIVSSDRLMIGSSNMKGWNWSFMIQGVLGEKGGVLEAVDMINTSICCSGTISTTHSLSITSISNTHLYLQANMRLNVLPATLAFGLVTARAHYHQHDAANETEGVWIAPTDTDCMSCSLNFFFFFAGYWYMIVRGPCPMMNTLANHGFLPRDGRNLTEYNVVKGLNDGLNFNKSLATIMFQQAIPVSPAYPNTTSFTL